MNPEICSGNFFQFIGRLIGVTFSFIFFEKRKTNIRNLDSVPNKYTNSTDFFVEFFMNHNIISESQFFDLRNKSTLDVIFCIFFRAEIPVTNVLDK